MLSYSYTVNFCTLYSLIRAIRDGYVRIVAYNHLEVDGIASWHR